MRNKNIDREIDGESLVDLRRRRDSKFGSEMAALHLAMQRHGRDSAFVQIQ